jgi:hypothetical protein
MMRAFVGIVDAVVLAIELEISCANVDFADHHGDHNSGEVGTEAAVRGRRKTGPCSTGDQAQRLIC